MTIESVKNDDKSAVLKNIVAKKFRVNPDSVSVEKKGQSSLEYEALIRNRGGITIDIELIPDLAEEQITATFRVVRVGNRPVVNYNPATGRKELTQAVLTEQEVQEGKRQPNPIEGVIEVLGERGFIVVKDIDGF